MPDSHPQVLLFRPQVLQSDWFAKSVSPVTSSGVIEITVYIWFGSSWYYLYNLDHHGIAQRRMASLSQRHSRWHLPLAPIARLEPWFGKPGRRFRLESVIHSWPKWDTSDTCGPRFRQRKQWWLHCYGSNNRIQKGLPAHGLQTHLTPRFLAVLIEPGVFFDEKRTKSRKNKIQEDVMVSARGPEKKDTLLTLLCQTLEVNLNWRKWCTIFSTKKIGQGNDQAAKRYGNLGHQKLAAFKQSRRNLWFFSAQINKSNDKLI